MWYKGVSPKDRRKIVEEKILLAIPKEPDEIKMKELLNKMQKGEPKISAVTLCKKLNQFIKKGMILRNVVSHKNVYYQRTHRCEIELALSEIHKKAFEILSELKEIKDWSRDSHIHTELGEIEISIKIKKKD